MKHTDHNLKIINIIGRICLGLMFTIGLFLAAVLLITGISAMVGEIIPGWSRTIIYLVFGFGLGRVLYIIDTRIKFIWKDETTR